jgi:hypothetical protein
MNLTDISRAVVMAAQRFVAPRATHLLRRPHAQEIASTVSEGFSAIVEDFAGLETMPRHTSPNAIT